MSDEVLLGTDGRTLLEIKRAAVAASASGANTVVAAVTGKKIRVLDYTLGSAGTVSAKWQSASTDLSGLLGFIAGSSVPAAYTPLGHIETVAGEALGLNLSTNVAVGGHLNYILI